MNRAKFNLVAALIIGVFLGAQASFVIERLPELERNPGPLQSEAGQRSPFHVGVEVVGVDDFKGLDLAAQAGADWVRIVFAWSRVQPDPNIWDWDHYDRLVARLKEHNLRAIATIRANPEWASSRPGGPIDRTDLVNLAEFAGRASARYRGCCIELWELYNEPDNTDPSRLYLGGSWGSEPEAYAEMLKAVYPRIKASNPEVLVAIGGLALDWFAEYDELSPDRPGPFNRDFLDRVLKAGGGIYFDVMNFHYYPNFRPRWEPYGTGIIGKATFVRQKLAEYGLNKRLICTETGAWSDAKTHGGGHAWQSVYFAQMAIRAAAADLEFVIWFNLVDFPKGVPDYGLYTVSLDPKPVLQTFELMAQRLAGTRFMGPIPPGELMPGIEGYLFRDVTAGREIEVVWLSPPAELNPPFQRELSPERITIQRAGVVASWEATGRQLPNAGEYEVGAIPVIIERERF